MKKINERGVIFKIFFFPAGNREISALHACKMHA